MKGNSEKEVTYVGDGVDVSSSQAEVTDDLKAPVVGSQVEGSSAILGEERRKEESTPGDT